jgi:hypothetical protein
MNDLLGGAISVARAAARGAAGARARREQGR